MKTKQRKTPDKIEQEDEHEERLCSKRGKNCTPSNCLFNQ